ncbi:restriction endonuclease [Streptomyces sp. NPDC005480]|uniref:restriction endonuclease n=1 Tax=Streptomyces sp. NPDC005480 TaxID=3154880 RepID=UPI0033A2F775
MGVAVPKFYEFMLPILRQLTDGEPRHWRELRDKCVAEFGLSEEDQVEATPGGQPRLDNRVLWANTYLFQAGLVHRPLRGQVQISDRGQEVLRNPPSMIDLEYLERFPEYQEFRSRTRKQDGDEPAADVGVSEQVTPLESMSAAVAQSTAALQGELLRRILAQPPEFLEHLVLKLLTAMGYGGQAGAVEHRGRSHDGGIDGIIRQDPLGIDRVYLQAKRYTDTSVGRPSMQAFVGALHGVQADRGVFITTSTFSQEARDYVERIPNRIILIDGSRLTELMALYNVGVQVEQTFTLKRIDEDFFE